MSQPEPAPDGRRTDGQHQTIGRKIFRKTAVDEARIEALADEFGDDTAGIRNALEIACDELDLEVDR